MRRNRHGVNINLFFTRSSMRRLEIGEASQAKACGSLCGHENCFNHRGVILPVVLFVLLLMGLLSAMFAFRINADVASMRGQALKLQTRLAAEAGVERIKLMLRSDQFNVDRWYDNYDELGRVVVWAHGGDPTVWGSNDKLDAGTMAYRFSIVADDPQDDETFVRYGITDESAKLNLNTITEEQLFKLVARAVEDDVEVDPQRIVNAILDWRDGDMIPRGDEADTEGEYYRKLDKPYWVKNGSFETVEELLLVKGLTARVLYGEDVDRNGLLMTNEDDGDTSFPPDNEDGRLNRGIYPYLTVHSYEVDVSNDRRPRVYLLGDEASVRAGLEKDFEDQPEIIDYLIMVTELQRQSANKGSKQQNGPAGQSGLPGGGGGNQGNGSGGAGGANGSGLQGGGDKSQSRRQVRDNGENQDETGGAISDEVRGQIQGIIDENGDLNRISELLGEESEESGTEGEGSREGEGQGEGETDGVAEGGEPILSPASLLRDQTLRGQTVPLPNPIGLEHLPVLLDRTTVRKPKSRERQRIFGLIDVNTASAEVLRCLEGLSEEDVAAIISKRAVLGSDTKATTAWLLTEQVLELETFERIAPFITARGQQFRIESIGFADHAGAMIRLEVVVDLMGSVAQTVYYRDLTHLGVRYPIREEDMERRQRGR